MSSTDLTRVAGVSGWPIAHSLSPMIMAHWIESLELDAIYAPVAIAPADPRASLRALAQTGLTGLNVTLPYKLDALAVADVSSARAQAIGAANLLTFRDGKIYADNTDGVGFLEAMAPLDLCYKTSTALVLGAGGAARAMVQALISSGIQGIFIANRNRGRAEDLAGELAPNAKIIDWSDRNTVLDQVDIAVNGTSLGLKGVTDLELEWSRLPDRSVAFDGVYTPLKTRFLAEAGARGLRTIDGLEMLIGQARPSFEAFFGQPAPQTSELRGKLIQALERS
jgi:shikimate dehydrogenase